MELQTLKERIIMSYEESFDLDVAFMENGVEKDMAAMLRRDESFMYRVRFADSRIRKRIITTLVSSLDSEDEKLAHKAALDLGNVLWADKFKGKQEEGKTNVPDSIVLKGKA